MKPHGIMFHHFHGAGHPQAQGTVSADDLNRVLDHYGDRILSAEDFYDSAIKGNLLPHHACITLDDRLQSQWDVAFPVLNARRLTSFWFVYTGLPVWEEVFWQFRAWYGDGKINPNPSERFYEDFDNWIVQPWKEGNVSNCVRMPEDYLDHEHYPFYTLYDRRFRYLRDVILTPLEYMHRMLDLILRKANHICLNHWIGRLELSALASLGHIVGSHTVSHSTDMTKMDGTDQLEEWLDTDDDTDLKAVSYPYGRGNSDTLAPKTRLAFRSCMAGYDGAHPLNMPREDVANILREVTK